MKTASFRIWTMIADFISYNKNFYAKRTSYTYEYPII